MLSTVILTKNEEKTIESAVKSASFADEIIIIDDNSADETTDIAEKFKCTVYKRALNNDFSSQRNFGMEKAKGEWVLFLDADEELSPALQKEIEQLLASNPKAQSFYIKRADLFWGTTLRHGEVKKAYAKGFIRLMKKGSGTWENAVHEEFKTTGTSSVLENYIHHYPHGNITEFIQSINYYSSLRSRELFKSGKRSSILEIIFYPFFKFIYTYFILQGFLDGPAGFVYSFLMSFHSFLVRSKLYQYEHISG